MKIKEALHDLGYQTERLLSALFLSTTKFEPKKLLFNEDVIVFKRYLSIKCRKVVIS